MHKVIPALLALALVSGCIAPSNPPPSARASAPAAATPAFRPAPPVRTTGIEGVVGQQARTLLSRFGEPRIDMAEGDARKLQFASARCVLDVFLYPRERGGEPVASHVEARERGSGQQIDRAACLADIARERAAR